MKRAAQGLFAVVVILPLLAAFAGRQMGAGFLHPQLRALTPAMVQQADDAFGRLGAMRENFQVVAPDRVILRSWKVRPAQPNGDWVLLFHGVADNRFGMMVYAKFLLQAGYGVLMMDARAHGESGGAMATYGWKERRDTRVIVETLEAAEKPHCVFALGESMGAALALQSAAAVPRVDGVVAESSFSNLREVAYDYAGLHLNQWLGKTLFRPAVWTSLRAAEKEGGFKPEDDSPERAVAQQAFPVLLICGEQDNTIPCRHTKRIYRAAAGPKTLWLVPGAGHTQSVSVAPVEFQRRILEFFGKIHAGRISAPSEPE